MRNISDEVRSLVQDAVFGAGSEVREKSWRTIHDRAAEGGIYPASIQGLYEAAGQGLYSGITVPAINIRGLTYDVARAVFRAALKNRVGAFIFEIARSEMGYTAQQPGEYGACILAAAVAEGFRGPVFLQGDHFQVNAAKFRASPQEELGALRELIRNAVDAGFYNIDIDASTVVDLSKHTLGEQQADNCRITADMTDFVRSIEPRGVTVSVGGEIGEVGGKNSTVEELRAFMSGYLSYLGRGVKGISKISVQTGTTHGGVVLPDGSIATVSIDFDTLKTMSRVARQDYAMGGAVQHGASTLPDEAFDRFPQAGTVEVHLATGFQNIIFDSPQFPPDLTERIHGHLRQKYAGEGKSGETDEQFFYKTRKRAFGDFKKEIWDIPRDRLDAIMATLEERFALIFQKLNVLDTVTLVNRYVAAR